MERKEYLVPFSGGLDSTYLVQCLLSQGHVVQPIYIKSNQGDRKIEGELEAVRKILPLMEEKKYSGFLRELLITNVLPSISNVDGPGRPMQNAFAQAVPWLYGLLEALRDYHECVAMAYVSGDSIAPLIDTIETVWNGMVKIEKFAEIPIEFPLIYTTKGKILMEGDEDFLEHIWVCERPHVGWMQGRNDVLRACSGSCIPCRTVHGVCASLDDTMSGRPTNIRRKLSKAVGVGFNTYGDSLDREEDEDADTSQALLK